MFVFEGDWETDLRRQWSIGTMLAAMRDQGGIECFQRDIGPAGAAGPKIAMSTRRVVRPPESRFRRVPHKIAVGPLHLPKELPDIGIDRFA